MAQKGTSPNGNTKATRIRARAWCWTWNNYTKEDEARMAQYLKTECIRGAFQPEVGKEGTPHLQGYFEFKYPRDMAGIKADWPKIHLEKARNIKAAMAYCTKEDTKAGNATVVDKTKRTVSDPLQGRTLHAWQQEIIDLVKQKPDDRKINWFYDEKGGAGKTSLAKHLCLSIPNEVVYICGKATDIKYGIKTFLDNKNNNLRVAIFDFTRSVENYISYEAIEAVKNGIFYNTKYESGMVVFDAPHIICFSNFKPDAAMLSNDRWVIRQLSEAPSGPPISRT